MSARQIVNGRRMSVRQIRYIGYYGRRGRKLLRPYKKKVARRGAPPYVEIIVCYVLANQNLGGFLALYADVETVSGVVYAYTLEVVVYYGSVSIFGDDVVDT